MLPVRAPVCSPCTPYLCSPYTPHRSPPPLPTQPGLEYDERLQKLESDKSSLQLQVSVLTEQIDAQTEKISELEDQLRTRQMLLGKAEDRLQKVGPGCFFALALLGPFGFTFALLCLFASGYVFGTNVVMSLRLPTITSGD